MVSSRVKDERELVKEKVVRFHHDDKQPPKSAHLPAKQGGGMMMIGRVASGSSGSSKVFSEDHVPWEKGILDPGSKLMINWNRVFLMACLLSLFVDPLFFYSPSVSSFVNGILCIKFSNKLGIIVTLFRTLADIFYIFHIVVKFRTAYVAPSSRVFGRGELVMNRKMIAKRYLRSDFFIDLVAALPLPQMVFWAIISSNGNSRTDYNNALLVIVLFQYILRLYLIFPLSNQMIKTNGVLTKTAWAGAAYNLVLYMLASHVLGASWYLLSINRQASCWELECKENCYFYCRYLGKHHSPNRSVFTRCNASDNGIEFKYGIFENALTKEVVSTGFIEKYLSCLWWGLQQLSAYGQDLETSTYVWETLFAILIAIMGLVLFAHLIGNMQTYLQSTTLRLEQWRLKRRDTEEWMRHRQLPHDLRDRVRKFLQYKWLATQGVDEESILESLPSDLRRDIQRHLCLNLVRRVPLFSQMDDQLLDAICERLVSSLSTEGTYIVREGDPVAEMLFIIRGRLESSTTNGGRMGFFNSITLRPGDFCGEELLAWALLPKASANLPSSTRTVKALTEVEAFALGAENLKFVSNQFRRLHSKKLQHTFRFYSHHWRTWAALFIQVAWRRHQRRKMAKFLITRDSFSPQQPDEQAGPSGEPCPDENCDLCSSRAVVLSSKDEDGSKLKKPDEPDFSADQYN